MSALEPGTVVDGRYEIVREVASGGFGVVYEGVHLGLGSKVAIKVARVDHVAPRELDQAIASFLEEGRVLKRLRHPNLVSAIDVGVLPAEATGVSRPYLVLDWCEGPTLHAWLAARSTPLGPAEAWKLLRPVVDAIAYAHAEGVVHRDLKPGNLLLETVRGELAPRVIDFGVAKLMGPDDATSGATQTSAARAACTPRYAAPEQLAGMRSGPRSDVHALALILVEVLRGRPVFDTDDDARAAILDRSALSPAALGLAFGGLDDVLVRSLALSPAARPRDAASLRTEIDAALGSGGDVVRARGPEEAGLAAQVDRAAERSDAAPSPETSATTGGRRRGVALVALLVGVIVAALAVGWLARRRPELPAAGASAEAAPLDPPPTSSAGYAKGAGRERPLRDLTPPELLERVVSGGLAGCSSQPMLGQTTIMCTNGMAILREGKFGGPGDATRMRLNLQYQAKMHGVNGRAARFTTDDAAGLVVAAPPDIVDALLARALDGVRHEAIGTEKAPPITAPVPARLADWTGMTLAARAAAIGIDLYSVDVTPAMSSVQGHVGGSEWVTIQLIHAEQSAWLTAAQRAGNPFAYAVDGDVIVATYGAGDFSSEGFVRKLLGPSAAKDVQKGR